MEKETVDHRMMEKLANTCKDTPLDFLSEKHPDHREQTRRVQETDVWKPGACQNELQSKENGWMHVLETKKSNRPLTKYWWAHMLVPRNSGTDTPNTM